MYVVNRGGLNSSDLFVVLFFFFKQKTAYERRISVWSSDVCSSDLGVLRPALRGRGRSTVLRACGQRRQEQRGGTGQEKRTGETKGSPRGRIGHSPILSPPNLAGH